MAARVIVVVGAGLAGHRAAESLRREGFDGRLVVVGDEPSRPYDRPPLSKALLSGAVDADTVLFDCAPLGDVEWRTDTAATALDLAAHEVEVAGGERLSYDGLVLATGRRARRIPAADGLDGVFTLRTIADSLALGRAARAAGRVVVIGAGFVGCEVAASLRTADAASVALVDVAPHPMPVLGPQVGARAAALHERHGVELHLGVGVEHVEHANGRVRGVRLADGTALDGEVVLVAVGSVANTEWLASSGLTLDDDGLVACDEFGFAAEDVVVAGDIAAFPHPSASGRIGVEHWSNAREMGAVAGANLLREIDARERHRAVPTFWSDQYDVKIKSAGLLGVADRIEVVDEDVERPSLVAEAYAGDRLVGAVAFNRPRAIVDVQRRLREELLVG